MSSFTRSVSLHSSYSDYVATKLSNVFKEWSKHLPYVRPCYSVSPASTPELISLLRNHNISMVCHNPREVKLVNHARLTIMNEKRFGQHECIVRKMKTLQPPNTSAYSLSSVPVWVHTTISNDGIDHTRKMFEHIWANKYILNGIVFDIANFTHPTQSIPPSIYSYKVGMDYVFRNIIHPFKKEYGISTPAIMIDGRHHISDIQHLFELNEYALSRSTHLWEKTSVFYSRPKLHLLVDRLLDS